MIRLYFLFYPQSFISGVLNLLCLIGLLAITGLFPFLTQAATVDPVVTEGQERVREGKQAQAQVDTLSDQTEDLVTQYRQVINTIEGLKVYNNLLQKQVDNQIAEISSIDDSIDRVSSIERQVVPLMVRMIDSLESFIQLDLPFLAQERQQRVADLRAMMERSDVTAAEKFRRVLEAYQIENDYGRTIEAYTGTLELDGKAHTVNFLRIGRVSLLFQTLAGERSGVWDEANREWVDLAPTRYRQQIADGLRIARKQAAPDLLVMPVPAPQDPAS
jgi:hypothetical protein